jgi:chromosome partitioning protein
VIGGLKKEQRNAAESRRHARARPGSLEARLGNRQAFVASIGQGLGVIESEPKSAAAEEAQALAREVEGRLG